MVKKITSSMLATAKSVDVWVRKGPYSVCRYECNKYDNGHIYWSVDLHFDYHTFKLQGIQTNTELAQFLNSIIQKHESRDEKVNVTFCSKDKCGIYKPITPRGPTRKSTATRTPKARKCKRC